MLLLTIACAGAISVFRATFAVPLDLAFSSLTLLLALGLCCQTIDLIKRFDDHSPRSYHNSFQIEIAWRPIIALIIFIYWFTEYDRLLRIDLSTNMYFFEPLWARKAVLYACICVSLCGARVASHRLMRIRDRCESYHVFGHLGTWTFAFVLNWTEITHLIQEYVTPHAHIYEQARSAGLLMNSAYPHHGIFAALFVVAALVNAIVAHFFLSLTFRTCFRDLNACLLHTRALLINGVAAMMATIAFVFRACCDPPYVHFLATSRFSQSIDNLSSGLLLLCMLVACAAYWLAASPITRLTNSPQLRRFNYFHENRLLLVGLAVAIFVEHLQCFKAWRLRIWPPAAQLDGSNWDTVIDTQALPPLILSVVCLLLICSGLARGFNSSDAEHGLMLYRVDARRFCACWFSLCVAVIAAADAVSWVVLASWLIVSGHVA